ncbi:MAG: hypothetical protein OET44_19105 [Gammaproteobacteria bacterium]|nr:hypothetical protein [Gammaproteobacteria bacterium]
MTIPPIYGDIRISACGGHAIGKGITRIITEFSNYGRSDNADRVRGSLPLTLLERPEVPRAGLEKGAHRVRSHSVRRRVRGALAAGWLLPCSVLWFTFFAVIRLAG